MLVVPAPSSGSLADAARDLAVCLLREMARRKGTVENVATGEQKKNPHGTQINAAFLPARLWLRFECGTSFVGNHGLLEYK